MMNGLACGQVGLSPTLYAENLCESIRIIPWNDEGLWHLYREFCLDAYPQDLPAV